MTRKVPTTACAKNPPCFLLAACFEAKTFFETAAKVCGFFSKMSAKRSSESEPLTEVAVIGGSGYLGGKIVKALLQQANMAVRSLDIAEARTPVKIFLLLSSPLSHIFFVLPNPPKILFFSCVWFPGYHHHCATNKELAISLMRWICVWAARCKCAIPHLLIMPTALTAATFFPRKNPRNDHLSASNPGACSSLGLITSAAT